MLRPGSLTLKRKLTIEASSFNCRKAPVGAFFVLENSFMDTLQQQVKTMLEMQDAMNVKIHPQWFDQGFEWYRAIWIECGEMLDHYGWKWWKQQDPDREQVILELVDIFHFGLSSKMDGVKTFDEIAVEMTSELLEPDFREDFRASLELLAAKAVGEKYFDVKAFSACMKQIELTTDELFRGYVGKNVLNFFRQDHGYKEGTYIKVWHGKEDNEHLVEVVAELDATSADFKKKLYSALEARYPG